MNEKTVQKLSYGIFVLTAKEGDKDNGCIVNTVIQSAAAPTRLCVSVSKHGLTHDMIVHTRQLAVSVLSEAASFDLIKRFGFQSGRDVNKFADFSKMKRTKNGVYYITEGTNGYFSGTVELYMDLGSHTLFTVEVEEMDVLSDVPSATYQYYHQHIKQA